MIAAIGAGFVLREPSDRIEPRPAGERPSLLLLTGLPILFPETFTLDSGESRVLDALRSRYQVIPISVADRDEIEGARLLLMAQPHAQPAEMLVELDQWVRGGGRLLLLADPALEWPSGLALGDRRRPPLAFADTGLLGHWGLRLDAPDRRGAARIEIDGRVIHARSPGSLEALAGNCGISAGGLIARCKIGQGQASIIADADFLDVDRQRAPVANASLKMLVQELERLEQ